MVIVDDYAHHPAEIRRLLMLRAKIPDKESWLFSNAHVLAAIALLDEFAEALDLADRVFLCVFFSSAREKAVTLKLKTRAKLKKGGAVISEDNVSPLLDFHDAVIIFMGAGDVQKFEAAYESLLSTTTHNVL